MTASAIQGDRERCLQAGKLIYFLELLMVGRHERLLRKASKTESPRVDACQVAQQSARTTSWSVTGSTRNDPYIICNLSQLCLHCIVIYKFVHYSLDITSLWRNRWCANQNPHYQHQVRQVLCHASHDQRNFSASAATCTTQHTATHWILPRWLLSHR